MRVRYNRTPRTNLLLAIADLWETIHGECFTAITDFQNTYRRDPAPAGTFDISALSNADAEKLASTTTLTWGTPKINIITYHLCH